MAGTRLVDNLFEFVRIPSESGSEQQFLDYLAEKLTREAAAVCGRDGYGNLVGTIAGKASQAVEPLLFAMHGDTVKPGIDIVPELRDGVIRSAGDTVLGADCKAGIAEFLEAVLSADRYPPLEFVVTREEEIGLIGARNLDYSLLSASRGFLLDMDAIDEVVVGGPSAMLLDVEVVGTAAHAGMEPEKGVNAIRAAAKAIAALPLGRLDHETTANVGVITGGIIRNGVPAACSFLAECRSGDHAKAAALAETMTATIRAEVEAAGAKVETTVDEKCRAVRIPEDAWAVQIAKRALATIGIDAKAVYITGFTDASVYNNHGIEMAVVGIGAQNEHSTEECVAVADMENAVRMLLEVFRITAQ